MSRSHKQILRATAIVGGASVMNVLIGLVRNKVAALLLGPAGIGTIGLLLNLVTTVASLAGLGIAMSGVRALAGAADDHTRARVRQFIRMLTVLLAMAGSLFIWLLRAPIAAHALGDPALAWQVGWLAPAVTFTIWSAMQIALLNGLQRLGDLARTQVGGAALGTALGIAALLSWGERGITAYVVAAPLGMVMIGLVYTARLPPRIKAAFGTGSAWHEMTALIRLGVPMMLGGLALPLGLLVIRAIVSDRLGPMALGQFTAAWTLSATYVGFVLAAMGTDYFPRLSAAIQDHDAARQMVNDQAEVALILALPVILGVQATAPWLLRLLYSDAFTPATAILHWQIAGDVLKLVSWPLAFVILAQGRGKLFWGIEAAVMTAMTGTVWLLVDSLGLAATGIAYFLTYALYLLILLVATQRLIGMRLSTRVVTMTALGLTGTIGIALIDSWSEVAALFLGIGMTVVSGGYTLFHLKRLHGNRATTGIQIP